MCIKLLIKLTVKNNLKEKLSEVWLSNKCFIGSQSQRSGPLFHLVKSINRVLFENLSDLTIVLILN